MVSSEPGGPRRGTVYDDHGRKMRPMKRAISSQRAMFSMLVALILALAAVTTVVARSTVAPARSSAQESTAIPPVPRPVYIFAGACGQLQEVLWPLNSLVSPNGVDGGSKDSDRTEYSLTANVPLTISAMLAGNYAISIYESADHTDRVLTCGNVGGVPDAVGTLVIGLRNQGGSDITGIAVLAPSPAEPSMTFVSVYISGGALGNEIGTIGVEQPVIAVPGLTETAVAQAPDDDVDQGDDNGNGEIETPDDEGGEDHGDNSGPGGGEGGNDHGDSGGGGSDGGGDDGSDG